MLVASAVRRNFLRHCVDYKNIGLRVHGPRVLSQTDNLPEYTVK